jgi:hypothetical protein
MANLKGLASIVSELRTERTNLASQLRHVDAALSSWQVERWEFHETEAYPVGLGS